MVVKEFVTMYYIYVIRNTINGKLYIGQTCDPQKRWHRHKSDAKSKIIRNKMVISRAITKHSYNNFTFTVIEEWQTLEEVNEAEIFWIEFFNTRNTNIGYNIEAGGRSGPNKITKIKISSSLRGKTAWNKGIKTGLIPWNKGTKGVIKANSGSFTIKTIYPKDNDLIKMINANGLSSTAKNLGITPGTLCCRLQKLNLKHNRLPGSQDTYFPKGKNHPNAKLTPEKVLDIVKLYNSGNYTKQSLADMFHVSHSNIMLILKGNRWNHVTHIK